MFRFKIQTDSEIPLSKQLFNQIQFAIASRHYLPGHRLPSTRQLARQTGLHRNTISKVYHLLEVAGLVESKPGSGIYVKTQGEEINANLNTDLVLKSPQSQIIVNQSLEELINLGYSLEEVKQLYVAEIDWRLRSLAKIIVTVPARDVASGELMIEELECSLKIAIELIVLEELEQFLANHHLLTLITSRYFLQEVIPVIEGKSVRIVAVDIYNYQKELKLIQNLPKGTYLGLVSLSEGTLTVAQNIVETIRGEEIITITCQADDSTNLNRLVRTTQTIISDRPSCSKVQQAIAIAKQDLIRFPRLICVDRYLSEASIDVLKAKLNLHSN